MKLLKPTDSLSVKILKILGASALFTVVSILSPAFPYAVLKAYLKHRLGNNYNNNQIHDSLKYLKRKKFIAYEFKQNKLKVIITNFGQQYIKRVGLNEITIKPTLWDGRWRLLTFDIPEFKKTARQTFRGKLKQLDFYHIQRSVFILPFPCESEIYEIANILKIRPFMHLLTCDRFPGDAKLVKKFNLKT